MSRRRPDPRAVREAVIVAVTPRVRIDRAHRGGAVLVTAPVEDAAAAPIRIDDPAFLVFAVIEAPGGGLGRHDRQVIGAARTLGGTDAAVVVLAADTVGDAGGAGGDRVMIVPQAGYDPDCRAQVIARAVEVHSPRHVVFAESADGGDLARRVAAILNEPLFDRAESLSPRIAIRPARGRASEFRAVPPRLISIEAEMIAPYRGRPHHVEAMAPVASDVVPSKFLAAAPLAVDAAAIPLDQAGLVIASGNGVTDFTGFLELAAALGATPGASRVVCDAGHLPRALQVGASGTVLNADCYVAFGISGAPQHLQGIGAVEHVVAVNIDLHAAIIARAELAIVADAQAVMPALLERLRAAS